MKKNQLKQSLYAELMMDQSFFFSHVFHRVTYFGVNRNMTFQHLNLQCNMSMKNLITKTQIKEF